jgi:hypothetical protein
MSMFCAGQFLSDDWDAETDPGLEVQHRAGLCKGVLQSWLCQQGGQDIQSGCERDGTELLVQIVLLIDDKTLRVKKACNDDMPTDLEKSKPMLWAHLQPGMSTSSIVLTTKNTFGRIAVIRVLKSM